MRKGYVDGPGGQVHEAREHWSRIDPVHMSAHPLVSVCLDESVSRAVAVVSYRAPLRVEAVALNLVILAYTDVPDRTHRRAVESTGRLAISGMKLSLNAQASRGPGSDRISTRSAEGDAL